MYTYSYIGQHHVSLTIKNVGLKKKYYKDGLTKVLVVKDTGVVGVVGCK